MSIAKSMYEQGHGAHDYHSAIVIVNTAQTLASTAALPQLPPTSPQVRSPHAFRTGSIPERASTSAPCGAAAANFTLHGSDDMLTTTSSGTTPLGFSNL
jgi:hypothetical protein